MGYKEAGDRLVHGISEGRTGQDYLIFPIFFLYRQYLEVMIKCLILECQLLAGIERPRRPRTADERVVAAQGHDLAALWAYLLKITPQVFPEFDVDRVAGTSKVVRAFWTEDKGGDAARYPVDLAGNRTLPGLSRVNLRILKEHMAEAEGGFHFLEGAFDYELERRGEAEMLRAEIAAAARYW